ncbi:MAG: ABC transporter permease [Candidatus Acidiferrales bacterium]
METLLQDIRYGLRTLAKNPGFTLVAVLTLALGIGANTAIFSVVHGVLLRPLPYPHADRLVQIYSVNPGFGDYRINMSRGDSADLATRSRTLESEAVYHAWMKNWSGHGEPAQLTTVSATNDLFSLLGIRPQLGRFFLEDELHAGGNAVVVLSDRLWHSRFGADRNVLGQTMILDGESCTVVGVAPPGFRFPNESADVWIPLLPAQTEDALRHHRENSVLALRRAGTNFAQVQAEVKSISGTLAKEYPKYEKDWSFIAVPLEEEILGDVRPVLMVLLAAVGFLLLIACANVANLLLARGWRRQREMAIRSALGASRRRVMAQLLVESCLVAIAGGIVAMLFAVWGVQGLLALAPKDTPRLDQIHPDWLMAVFAAGVSLVVGILCGLAPALGAARVNLNRALKSDEVGGSRLLRSRRGWLSRSLVAVEVALTLVLLIGSTLMLESLGRLTNVQTGMRTDHTVSLSVLLPNGKYPKEAQQRNFLLDALARLKAEPGVTGVAASTGPVLQGSLGFSFGIMVDGRTEQGHGLDNIEVATVTPDFFRVFGLPIIRGRLFDDSDREGAPKVVIVNEAFGKLAWGKDNPLGGRISFGKSDGKPDWTEVIGVVADARDVRPNDAPRPEMYWPLLQSSSELYNFSIRTASEPLAAVPAIRSAIWSVDPDLPINDVTTIDAAIAETHAAPRFRTTLLATFAGLGVVLALVGIYGVLSYFAAQRTREIGIRMALGAEPGDVLRMIVGQGMKMVMAGIVLGVLGSLALTRLLTDLLYEVRPTDPLTYVGVSVLLVGVALAACWLPARRAMRVDPMVALRYE